jgi:hypothetical protein
LQLTKLAVPNWSEVKRAITPQAVRKINEAILEIWPPTTDIGTALKPADARQIAFFSGDYRPSPLLSSIGRHLLYADRVALADPFQYPLSLRDEYNPLLHPEKHRTTTAKNVMVWFRLADLIRQGLVNVIRLPSDFDHRLRRTNMKASEALVQRYPELDEAVKKAVRYRVDEDNHESEEWWMLCQPDEEIVSAFLKAQPGAADAEVAAFLAHVHKRRDEHPYYLPHTVGDEELIAETTGSTPYDSVQVANLTGAYLLTDLEPRWRQFEFLQREAQQPLDDRSRVARGLQNIRVPMAAHLDLRLAQRIREEGQLDRVRAMLDKLMRQAGSERPLSDSEAKAFEDELLDAIAEAKDEYAEIDRELLKFTGGELIGLAGLYGMTGGALTISLGAAAAAGALNLVGSTWKRRSFKARYPAAMFMDLPLTK